MPAPAHLNASSAAPAVASPAVAEARQHLQALARFGVRLGLDGVRQALACCGNPERRVPAILVAGTNGKGSVAATLAAILTQGGVRSALFTSPHLIDVTERLRFDEVDIAGEELAERVLALRDRLAAAAIEITHFEFLTVLALVACAERRSDVAILEIGLGGRHDATNASAPILGVVTSIGADHTDRLGTDPAAIAREKAGIARAGVPLLVGDVPAPAAASIAACAAETGSLLHWLASECSVESVGPASEWTADPPRQRLRLRTPAGSYELATPLVGEHQIGNVALAVRAAELAAERLGLRLDRAVIERGVATTRWPGRLEALPFAARGPGARIWLDGAHNPPAAAALAAFMDSAGWSGRAELVVGVMGDKDLEAVAAILFPRVRRVVATRAAGIERARDPAEIAAAALRHGAAAVIRESVGEALAELARGAGDDMPALVTGSLYVVGEARAIVLGVRGAVAEPPA